MARIRFVAFAGEVPKIASHLLQDQNAQNTLNVKVDSGMLEAWNAPETIENTLVDDPLSMYKYIQDDGATEDWYVSDEDLDFVDNPQSNDTYERVYFAGAVSDDYLSDRLVTSETVVSYDPSTGVITLTTDFSTEFAVGDWVQDVTTLVEYEITAIDLSGGAGADTCTIADGPASLSATIHINETKWTPANFGEKEVRFFANDIDGVDDFDGSDHYSVLGVPAPAVACAPWVDTGAGGGRGEGTNDYSYVYTFVNEYDEEGPPSTPTSPTSMDTADPVYVAIKPPYGLGTNEAQCLEDFHYFLTSVRLYRTETGVTSTDFLLVKEQTVAATKTVNYSNETVNSYVPATGVLTMATDFSAGDIDPAKYHYVMDRDNDRYYLITAVSLGGGAGADTITIGDAKPNILSAAVDIVQFEMTDDTDIADLGDPIESEDYYPPVTGLDGLTSMASGHLYGWKDNMLYYSFPYLPHAWKTTDIISLDQDIVVARGFANTMCIATTGNPYVLSGQSPRTFSKIKMGKWLPCISKRAAVKLDSEILYPSNDGLISLSANGATNITKKLIRREDWIAFQMDEAFGLYQNDRYYGFPNNATIRGFIIDFNDQQFIRLSPSAECGYITPDDDILYYVSIDSSEGASGTRRSIKSWQGDTLSYLTYSWKSKKVLLPRNVNMGVARIELDDDFYSALLDLLDDNEYLQGLNATLFEETLAHEDVGTDSYVPGTGVITLTADFTAGDIIAGHHRVQDQDTGYCYPIDSVSLGGGAGADTVTLDTVSGGGETSPPATLSDPINITLPRDLQGTINGGNLPATRAGRQVNRHTINGDILFDLNNISASPYINMVLWVDGVQTYEKNVQVTKAFKLPRGTKGKRWEIQLSGTIPVRRFDMATTTKELLQ